MTPGRTFSTVNVLTVSALVLYLIHSAREYLSNIVKTINDKKQTNRTGIGKADVSALLI